MLWQDPHHVVAPQAALSPGAMSYLATDSVLFSLPGTMLSLATE